MTATKTRVAKGELLAALEAAEPGLSPRDIVEQSSCIVFRAGWVIAFNDEICVRVKGPLPPDIGGAVHGKPFLESVRRMKSDDLQVWPSGGRLWVQGGRQRAYGRMDSEILLPLGAVEKPDNAAWVKVHPDFLPALTMAHEFAGRDDSQFAFTCVHLTPNFVEACDSTQMLRVNVTTGIRESVLVRKEAVKAVAGLGVTRMAETNGWVHFRAAAKNEEGNKSPELVISCRRYLEEYDDLSGHLEFQGTKVELPSELVEASAFAEVYSQENSDDNLVTVTLKPGWLHVEGLGNTGGAEQKAKMNYDGESLAFRIAPKMLARVVERYKRCEIGPTKLKATGANWTYVTALGVPNDSEEVSYVGAEDGSGDRESD